MSVPAAYPITCMAEENKGLFGISLPNPFAKSEKAQAPPAGSSSFSEPQPGDPGYKGSSTSSEPAATKVAPASAGKKAGFKLPVVSGSQAGTAKRGLDLLREDVFKNAPEVAGVGRQDQAYVMKPQPGEPGYKPQAYEVVKQSDLGISSFADDANAAKKVGGLAAVKRAANAARAGKSAKELKSSLLNQDVSRKQPNEPAVYDIPDYLKPLPEDTPRAGKTWKNY